MTNHLQRAILAVALSVAGIVAHADESSFQLKAGEGRDLVLTHCSACHSVDYIPMNSPFPDRKLWETEVKKMINAFGAPIPQEDIAPVVDYLVRQYGHP